MLCVCARVPLCACALSGVLARVPLCVVCACCICAGRARSWRVGMDRVCARVCRTLHEVCCMLRAEGCLRSHVARRFFACHSRHGSTAAGVDGCASSASCQLILEAVRAHTHTATHAHTARAHTHARARKQPEPCGTSAHSAQCRLPLALVPSVRTAWCLKAPQGREQGRVQSAGGSPPTRQCAAAGASRQAAWTSFASRCRTSASSQRCACLHGSAHAMRCQGQRSAGLEIARSDLLAYAVDVGTGSAAYPT